MDIKPPQFPTFSANENIKSFQDVKRHKAAREVIEAVMNGVGRAKHLAENDNRGVYDDFPEVGIAGKMSRGTHDDSIEFVRFDTDTGEIQEFGRETSAQNGHNDLPIQFHFEQLPLGCKFMRVVNGKATTVTLSSEGALVDIKREWNEGF